MKSSTFAPARDTLDFAALAEKPHNPTAVSRSLDRITGSALIRRGPQVTPLRQDEHAT